MTFTLPDEFSHDVNELGDLMDAIDSAVDEDKEDEFIRQALVKACRLLDDLDSERFAIAAARVARAGTDEGRNHLLNNPLGFSLFLRAEDRIMRMVGIKKASRKRIIDTLREAREYLREIQSDPYQGPDVYGERLARLTRGVCDMKDEKLDDDRRSEAKRKLPKVLAKVGAIINAAAPVVAPFFPDLLPQDSEIYSASVVLAEVLPEE